MSWEGEPGPYGVPCEVHVEAELVDHLIMRLEQDADSGVPIHIGDGYNYRIPVDEFALRQALGVLKKYRSILE